jgi:hypothetical protein
MAFGSFLKQPPVTTVYFIAMLTSCIYNYGQPCTRGTPENSYVISTEEINQQLLHVCFHCNKSIHYFACFAGCQTRENIISLIDWGFTTLPEWKAVFPARLSVNSSGEWFHNAYAAFDCLRNFSFLFFSVTRFVQMSRNLPVKIASRKTGTS